LIFHQLLAGHLLLRFYDPGHLSRKSVLIPWEGTNHEDARTPHRNADQISGKEERTERMNERTPLHNANEPLTPIKGGTKK
jgi:hypothetical protein